MIRDSSYHIINGPLQLAVRDRFCEDSEEMMNVRLSRLSDREWMQRFLERFITTLCHESRGRNNTSGSSEDIELIF